MGDGQGVSVDKSREDFEVWASDNGASPRAIHRGTSGGYLLMSTHTAWEAWQASRMAVVVEISPDYGKSEDYSDYHHGWNMRGNAEKENLRAAGITIKGERDGDTERRPPSA